MQFASLRFFILLQTALDIAGVQDLVCLMAVGLTEELVVEHLYRKVVLRLTKRISCIVVVKNRRANRTQIHVHTNACGLNGLTSAVDTTAGASHDLDKLNVELTALNHVQKLLGHTRNTNITPGIGTARPYEYIGAPFIKTGPNETVPVAEGVMLRPCSFTPSCGRYEGKKCFGYQIMREPGVEYHSLMHTLQLLRYFKERYEEFMLEDGFEAKISDQMLLDYICGRVSWEETREHIKVEEQKWIRKAKKFVLYDDQPYRIK